MRAAILGIATALAITGFAASAEAGYPKKSCGGGYAYSAAWATEYRRHGYAIGVNTARWLVYQHSLRAWNELFATTRVYDDWPNATGGSTIDFDDGNSDFSFFAPSSFPLNGVYSGRTTYVYNGCEIQAADVVLSSALNAATTIDLTQSVQSAYDVGVHEVGHALALGADDSHPSTFSLMASGQPGIFAGTYYTDGTSPAALDIGFPKAKPTAHDVASLRTMYALNSSLRNLYKSPQMSNPRGAVNTAARTPVVSNDPYTGVTEIRTLCRGASTTISESTTNQGTAAETVNDRVFMKGISTGAIYNIQYYTGGYYAGASEYQGAVTITVPCGAAVQRYLVYDEIDSTGILPSSGWNDDDARINLYIDVAACGC